MDLNKVMLIGRLTRDPEARTTAQGVTVANFGLATSRVWKDAQGNQQDVTEFHNVVAWRRLGEICAQYLTKGKQVFIEGHLQTRNWVGQDGKKNYRTEVVADNMIMLGSKGDGPAVPRPAVAAAASVPAAEPASASDQGAGPAAEEEIRIEDIPF
jgi:single-strand DNA-binding protein